MDTCLLIDGWRNPMRRFAAFLLLAVLLPAVLLPGGAFGASEPPLPGTVTIRTNHGFAVLVERLADAVEKNEFAVVTRASASAGAAKRGVAIPGNLVMGVYRNDYAVRMLAASVASGIEAPLRFYVTENADGTANLVYRKPSAIFAPYASAELDAMAAELDPIWAAIATESADR